MQKFLLHDACDQGTHRVEGRLVLKINHLLVWRKNILELPWTPAHREPVEVTKPNSGLVLKPYEIKYLRPWLGMVGRH
jgi:hypothetical protein